MSALRPLCATAGCCLRGLTGWRTLCGLCACAGLAVLCGLGLGDASDELRHRGQIRLLGLLLWLPGLWVAWQFRAAWPALGRGDEARGWLLGIGRGDRRFRLAALAGAVVGLAILQLGSGLLVGLGSQTLSARSPFRWLGRLPSAEGERVTQYPILARSGDEQRLHCPPGWSGAELVLHPLYYLGARDTLSLSVRLEAETGGSQMLGEIHVADLGGRGSLVLPAAAEAGGVLVLQRLTGDASGVRLGPARCELRGGRLPALLGAALGGLGPLPWSLCLCFLAFGLAPHLGAATQRVACLGLAPLLAQLPACDASETLVHLSERLAPSSSQVDPRLAAVLLGLVLAGCLGRGAAEG